MPTVFGEASKFLNRSQMEKPDAANEFAMLQFGGYPIPESYHPTSTGPSKWGVGFFSQTLSILWVIF